MNQYFEGIILNATNARALGHQELIQSLWSGYGEILKVQLVDGDYESIILKYIELPENSNHPRGWNTNRSHQRKIKSYNVETAWYKQWSQYCHQDCRVPKCLATASQDNSQLIVMEDLDAAGFHLRKSVLSSMEVKACLKWLAQFHGTFLDAKPDKLWESGTYWHLATRPDEFGKMKEGLLKQHAAKIDNKLSSAKYKTLVHGDAKVANFCFAESGQDVAAVDFQYVGAGCGMKDIAYFLGSCLDEHDCLRDEERYLDYYFTELKQVVANNDSVNALELENEWRELYAWAWTDFYRFLSGWMPDHHKIHTYTKRLADKVFKELL